MDKEAQIHIFLKYQTRFLYQKVQMVGCGFENSTQMDSSGKLHCVRTFFKGI